MIAYKAHNNSLAAQRHIINPEFSISLVAVTTRGLEFSRITLAPANGTCVCLSTTLPLITWPEVSSANAPAMKIPDNKTKQSKNLKLLIRIKIMNKQK
jgi:hypothetical protein